MDDKISKFVFKELVEGDFRKFEAQSNDSPTGGGARDLRYTPADKFYPFFEKMIPNKDAEGTLYGKFYWTINGKKHITDAIVHKPTNARPSEVRLACVNKNIPDAAIPADHKGVFFVIVQLNSGILRPFFIPITSLSNNAWDHTFRRVLTYSLNVNKRANVQARGYYDYMTKEEFYYGM